MTSRVVVIAGGGTAGHVLPALAVADGLVDLGYRHEDIHYLGAQRGVETRLVPPSGIPHTFLDVVGLARSLHPRNLRFVTKMIAARRQATVLMRRLRPAVVVSVGGYASLPAVLAARRLRVPVVVVSYDKRPGRASAFAARRAAACAVAFPDSPLPRAVHTGAPLRRAVREVNRSQDRERARRELGLPDDRLVVAVMGGSLGSSVLNEATASYIETHAQNRHLAVRHVCGDRFLDKMPSPRDGEHGILYDVVGFEPRMPLLYAAADVLVGRGGASTVCEVAAVGIPAVLVPWAGAAEDHQTANVRWLSDIGAAVLIPEAEITAERFAAEVDRLLADPDEREALAARAFEAGAPHRSDALARLIDGVARG